jgi:dephospho-CoA kinase
MVPGSPVRIVLTGGIGSGKSLAARILAQRGFEVIDADRLGHELLEPDGASYSAVVSRWPQAVGADGRIDRRALGRLVFAEPAELDALVAIQHPRIRAELARRVEASGNRPVAVEVSVPVDLTGPGWTKVVIDSPDETRRRRLLSRGMDPGEVDGRMAAQPTREQWLALADVVVDNSGDQVDLFRLLDTLVCSLLKSEGSAADASRDA